MRTIVITGTLILATGFAAYASTAVALDARMSAPAQDAATTVDAVTTNLGDDELRALGAAMLGARDDAADRCALPSLS